MNRRPGRLSLAARLLLITVTLLAVGLAVGGGVVLHTLRDHLVGQVDARLEPIAQAVSRLPSVPADDVGAQAGAGRLDLARDLHVLYLDGAGRTTRVVTLGPGGSAPDVGVRAAAHRDGRPFDVRQGGRDWRVVALPHPAGGDQRGTVAVVASLDDVTATVGQSTRVALLTGLGLLVLLAVTSWAAIRGSLRPLRRVEQTAAAIAAGDLAQRVPAVGGARTEVGRLVAALNGMLAQIERAFTARAESEARMRRFVADVSHELRTPLFGITGFTELYRMGGLPGPADVDRTMTHIAAESSRLARLVEDLLLLARLDESLGRAAGDAGDGRAAGDAGDARAAGDARDGGAAADAGVGGLPLRPAPMDLRTLAVDARHDLTALDPGRPITLTGPGGGPVGSAPALGDEARLRQVVLNLVGNVVAHTPAGSPVRIGVGTAGGEAVLEVADQGPGLSAEQAARVFERFYRTDSSRSRAGGAGAGLGLAIVDSLVRAHGGRVELVTAPGAGATFRVVLPVLVT
uniref:histidine kinase n=1 Tax=Micromonospora sp. GMKU326 TaxID=718015 RepID=A0A0B6VTA1_9ACTN|nr:two-component system sensor kinase [Micromonospora sp. GMKU326]